VSIYNAKRFEAQVGGLFAALGESFVSTPVESLEVTYDGIPVITMRADPIARAGGSLGTSAAQRCAMSGNCRSCVAMIG
jgi:hypothetical protein